MATTKKTADTKAAPAEATYSREELRRATTFAGRGDLLTALVKDGEKLTLAQAQKRIEDFMKGKVK